MKHKNNIRKWIAFLSVLFLWLFCLSATGEEAGILIDTSNFPDAAFREIVIDRFDRDSNGVLSREEAEVITDLDLSIQGEFHSLKGIEFFPNLIKLDCSWSGLETLDLSHNPALIEVDCSCNKLSSLEINNHPTLETLNCSSNELTTLTVSNNPALIMLNCCENELTTLNVNNNAMLTEVLCARNLLTRLDVSNNPALATLDCGNNQLTTLDVSQHNPALKELVCSANKLTTLNLGHNSVLRELFCSSNQLNSLDISGNPVLKRINCGGNKLTTLDINSNPALVEMVCSNNKLTVLDLSNNPDLSYLYCSNNELITLNVSHNQKLVKIQCKNNNLTALDVGHNSELRELFCENNQLSDLDVRNNLKLEILDCSTNQLVSLDVDHNLMLNTIKCSNNILSFLDINHNSELLTLECHNNQLSTLNITNCSELKQLYKRFAESEDLGTYRKITGMGSFSVDKTVSVFPGDSIAVNDRNFPDDAFREYVKQFDTDRSGNLSAEELDAVKVMDIAGRNIRNMKGVEFFSALTELNCSGNPLTELDLIDNHALMRLDCSCTGSLKQMDLSNCRGLIWLKCRENALTKLDLSSNHLLEYLDCSGNQLLDLDIGNCILLEELYCGTGGSIAENNLNKLDVSKNTMLRKLYCLNNPFTELDISHCSQLVNLINDSLKKEANSTGNYYYWQMDNKELFIDRGVHLITEETVNASEEMKAFVTRCYRIILGREADVGGMKTWVNELGSGRKTASEIIDRFVNSPEYLNKNYNYGDSVDILYRAMLGRNADAGGKANWVKKLESGQTLAHVINGFCFSKEFRSLCDSYGIKAGFVNIPNTDTTAEGKIKAFVQRCYRIILDREADPSGMQTWYEQLSSGKKAAAEIIDRFVNSPEFQGKNYSYGVFVDILYKAMMGRNPDEEGKAHWVEKLKSGTPFAIVINGFCYSREFIGICESYGIIPGHVIVQYLSDRTEEELSMLAYKAKAPITKKSETNPTRVEIINPSDTIDMNIGTAVQAVYINEEKAKEFISRCYQCILGRDASQTELANWIGQMTNGTKTPDQIARGFLFSNEFKGRNVGNEDLVKILYKVYMNRDADPEGLKTWTEKLDGGTSLNDLLNTFSRTNEYKKIVREMAQ